MPASCELWTMPSPRSWTSDSVVEASDEPIRVVAYDPQWPALFERERILLNGAIGPWIVGGIHHVGSTAIPGLDAKPIIDILVGIEDLTVSRACFNDSGRFRDELAFRDHLRTSPEIAREYAALKHRLAGRFSRDREAYTDAKADFVYRVLGNAGTASTQSGDCDASAMHCHRESAQERSQNPVAPIAVPSRRDFLPWPGSH
jgi:GrpB-like predicted nucleotidyltransferase (UPF0157 family)